MLDMCIYVFNIALLLLPWIIKGNIVSDVIIRKTGGNFKFPCCTGERITTIRKRDASNKTVILARSEFIYMPWSKDYRYHMDKNESMCTLLHIQNLKAKDSGSYCCFQDETLIKDSRLEVCTPPQLQFNISQGKNRISTGTLASGTIYIRAERNIRVTCEAKGYLPRNVGVKLNLRHMEMSSVSQTNSSKMTVLTPFLNHIWETNITFEFKLSTKTKATLFCQANMPSPCQHLDDLSQQVTVKAGKHHTYLYLYCRCNKCTSFVTCI